MPEHAPKRRALVIDDEAGVRGVLRRWLARRGWTVTEASNGAEARAQLQRAQGADAGPSFDLVVCDLRMPTLCGQGLYAWVAEHQPALLTHLVFASGDVREERAATFLQGSGCPVLEKPFAFEDLEAIIAAR
jgi:CheY-like chemotaxis protein